MSHIKNIDSRVNRNQGGGDKKQGAPDHSNWSRIPYKIFKSRTPKPFLFNATTGKIMTQTTTTE